MILNHLNLPTPDPQAVAEFFCTCFGFEPVTQNRFITVLRGDGDFILNLTNDVKAAYPGIFHTGFTLGRKSDVEAVHAMVTQHGYLASDIEHVRRPTGWEALEFMITAPGGISVQVQCPITQ